MIAELTKLASQPELLISLIKEVKLLKVLISDREYLEQCTRRDDLVITGLKHRIYTSVAANINTTEDASQEELLIL